MSSLSHSYSSVCQTSGPKSVAFRVVFLSVAWPGPPCAALSGKASASDPYVSFFTRSWQGRGRRGGTQGLAWKAGASAADHAAASAAPFPSLAALSSGCFSYMESLSLCSWNCRQGLFEGAPHVRSLGPRPQECSDVIHLLRRAAAFTEGGVDGDSPR